MNWWEWLYNFPIAAVIVGIIMGYRHARRVRNEGK